MHGSLEVFLTLRFKSIPSELFKETIAPLLLVEHTALIGITTPMEEVRVRLNSMITKF